MDNMILDRLNNVTGIVCYNDQVASALIRLLKRGGKRVPEDFSLVSFDNSFLAKQMVCNLTSVIYPAKKVGKKSAEILLKCMNNPKVSEHIKLEPILKIRESVKKIK